MYIYQYILLAGFACLLFNKETRFAAIAFIIGWVIYLVMFIDASSTYKYIACASIEFSIAYALNNKHIVVSFLGYSLILVNLYGLGLYKNGISPVSYDIIYAIISVLQFLMLLSRALLNGIPRLRSKHIMVRLVNFDSSKAYDRMYKSKTEKG